MNIKFRENWTTHKVEVFVNDLKVAAYAEYYHAVKYVQQKYGVSDDVLLDIYRDYKEDYDS